MAKAMKDPRRVAQKQIDRLSAAVPDIEAGVNAVQDSPTSKAADNLEKAADNYVKAIRSGKMGRNLRAVSLEEWKRKTTAKVNRIPEGARESMETIVAFHDQRNAKQSEINRELEGIPKRTLDDSIRRMTAQVKGMSEFSFDKSKI
jgi:hypothetical protein